ncbi:hypothetical protein HOLleu_01438 [Holothuria leucospilota]|uniref:Uncharacterized protein n=1 Tax=Holothuria leucospilota TaxID=206669 RepID=A0A9Q1HKY2_HOLLE|nr:hypothetical protein HOLleu_01438 [Holothuria leucospilota]
MTPRKPLTSPCCHDSKVKSHCSREFSSLRHFQDTKTQGRRLSGLIPEQRIVKGLPSGSHR